MARYAKRPVAIEAIQWDGNNLFEVANFLGKDYVETGQALDVYVWTLEGTMKASVGDYIIRGVEGEHYPCKPAIFEKTYDALD